MNPMPNFITSLAFCYVYFEMYQFYSNDFINKSRHSFLGGPGAVGLAGPKGEPGNEEKGKLFFYENLENKMINFITSLICIFVLPEVAVHISA